MTVVHYPRAPILEAIIDIQARFRTPPPQELFAEIASRVASRFPQSAPFTQIGIGVGFGPQVTVAQPSIQPMGIRMTTAKNERVLIVQSRGLTFSHMPPYSEWEPFRDEGMRLWELFVEITKPEAVTRAALRYINRFEIPRPQFELSEYFVLRPEIPESGIPQMISAFFMQCQTPQPDLGPDVTAIMNLGSAGTAPPGSQHIILDFDVFATREIPPSMEVWELLEKLRTRKNELFEACITDRARELIK